MKATKREVLDIVEKLYEREIEIHLGVEADGDMAIVAVTPQFDPEVAMLWGPNIKKLGVKHGERYLAYALSKKFYDSYKRATGFKEIQPPCTKLMTRKVKYCTECDAITVMRALRHVNTGEVIEGYICLKTGEAIDINSPIPASCPLPSAE